MSEFRAALRGKTRHDSDTEIDLVVEMILTHVAGNLSWYAAQDLVPRLPPTLGRVVHMASFGSSMTRFAPAVMVARIAERQGLSPERIRDQVKAVLGVLSRSLPPSLWKKIEDDLPSLMRLLRVSVA